MDDGLVLVVDDDPQIRGSFIAALDEIASCLGPSDLSDVRTRREV